MKISTYTAPALIMDVLRANLVPMLTSSPGVGKSSIAKDIAKKHNLKLIDVRLSQVDPTELNGFPFINEERTKASYVPMKTFPIEGDKIPTNYNGWLLLLDEFNSAPLSTQAAAYRIVLDKEVGEFKLHPKVAIIAAGNLATDKAITNRLSTAMQSRLIHLELETDIKAWLYWASKNNIDYRVTAYIAYQPEMLHQFDPDHNDNTFSCPRTWEFVSKIMHNWKELTIDKLPLIIGTIGEGAARQFFAFCQLFGKLPTIEDIENNPETAIVPNEPSEKYAVTGLLTHNMTVDNADTIMLYLLRLNKEFQTITLQNALGKLPMLQRTKQIKNWIKYNAQELMPD